MGDIVFWTKQPVRPVPNVRPIKMTIAWRLGALSHDAGIPITACPFRMISHREQYRDWVNGWQSADMGDPNAPCA